jgi:putative NADPH-quinone reductase
LIDQFKISYSNSDVKIIHLRQLAFDYNYRDDMVDEEEILAARESIVWSDHIVFAFPLWWGSFPALLKAFIDRVFIAGFAYKYAKDKQLPLKLLIGKTASMAITMDSPIWYYRYFKGARAEKQLKDDILGFCGIRMTSVIRIGSVRSKNWKILSEEIAHKVNGSIKIKQDV